MPEICLVCLQDTTSYIKLGDGVESTEIRSKLAFCVPDAVFHKVKDPAMCNSCHNALNSAYTFIRKCRSTNKHILNYIQLYTEIKAIKTEGESELECSLECKNKLEEKNLICEATHFHSNTNLHDKYAEKLSRSETEPCERDNSVDLENDQSISKFLEQLKLECDEETAVFQTVDDCTNSSASELELEAKTTSALIQNKGKNILKDCFVKLTRLNVRSSSELELEAKTTSALIQNKGKNILKDCFVKLTRLNVRSASELQLEANTTSALIQNKGKNISKDCFVKLIRLNVSYKKASKKVKANPRPSYECDVCGYKTTINSNFGRHMRIHNGNKPYSCDKCDYSTSVKSNLQSHLNTHLKKKPYQCDKCEFSTACQSNLKKHISTHDGKMFKCDLCQFATASETSLKNHVSMHTTGEKPYHCDKCSLSFFQKCKLERHLVIHSKTKKFKCEHCEYSSVRKDTLARHVKRKH